MPRRTAKSKKNNVNTKTCHIPTTNAAVTTPTKNARIASAIRKGKAIKQEKGQDTATETVTEQVVHRKSERRRVARDIFLVFEEQPSSRRSGRTNKKQPTKPKFGHLKVEEPIKSKGLLRDIKNEPKCYLNSSSNTSSSNTVAPQVVNNNKIQKEVCVVSEKKTDLKKKKLCTLKLPSITGNAKNNKVEIINVKTVDIEVNTNAGTDALPLVARVNPIFLWVKQDDTRIVEVRCEDYDKRNRIRLTKTSNGWRAIPRSDPTSSKVLKFYPTPLMKVKRENHVLQHEPSNSSGVHAGEKKQSNAATNDDFLSQNTLKDALVNNVGYGIETVVCNPLATTKKVKKKKSSKRKKKSLHCRKTSKTTNVTATKEVFENNENPLSVNTPSSVANYISNENSATDHYQKIQNDFSNVRVECKIDKDVTGNRISTPSFVEFPNQENALESNIKPLLIIPIAPAIRLSPINEVAVTSDVSRASESEHTYQKEMQNEFSFQLCPKTGLFLPNNRLFIPHNDHDCDDEIIENQRTINLSRATVCSNHNQNNEQLVTDLDKATEENKSQTMDDNTAESLEAKTKNLKDLLDDADLLQHCDDNANSDAELIDTLVKTSCENNLIQANEIIAKGSHIDHLQQKGLHNGTDELVDQLITDVSDPPKCLSFNEAGEIEGLNGELFQANSYIESFEKQPTSALISNTQLPSLHSMSVVTSASSALSVPQTSMICGENIPILDIMDISDNSKVSVQSVIEESPKDLSYKKREEVCPPSESRSQCAVTSSSDVIKSPQHDNTSVLTSSSETLKNLILEQFIKLNALSTNKQNDPINLGKKKQPDKSNTPVYTGHGQKPKTSNFIETVVIDDDDEEFHNSDLEGEPLKKRIRLNNKVENVNVKAKMTLIDKDPDPLTQLRLLIKNTQWKVPDPILVPKDRLTAVLASPAREIPLLITTRPELRLPEAFAYPEIIQNPNILVISMAQLEAILQNEIELDKTSKSNDVATITDIASPEQQTVVKRHQHQALLQQRNILNSNTTIHEQNADLLAAETTSAARKDESTKCSHIDSSLASDINTATMAVLNQMLWLPYFGQISHDLIKSLKNPHGLQQKCAANLMPFYSSQLNGLQNIEEVYKTTKILHQNEPSTKNGLTNLRQQGCSNDDLTLLQKIVQHQMHSVLQSNQLKSPDTSQRIAATTTANAPNPLQSSIETTSSHIESLSNFIEQKKQKNCVPNDNFKSTNPPLTSNTFAQPGESCNMNVSEKSYNLRSSVANRQTSESKQYSSNNQRQNADHKPRLTCKSLSNLLDPEHSYQHSLGLSSDGSCIPFVSNEASEFHKGSNGVNAHTIDCKSVSRVEGRRAVVSSEGKMVPPPSARSVCSISNPRMETFNEFSKQHKPKSCFGDNKASESSFGNDASVLSAEANAPLWHPLFGSNSKSAYSSPWQWTTVTASGE